MLQGRGAPGDVSRGRRQGRAANAGGRPARDAGASPSAGLRRVAALLLVAAAFLALAGCRSRPGDMAVLQDLAREQSPTYHGRPVSKDTLEAVRKVLDLYRKDVTARVQASEELASLYKSLALKYLDIGVLRQQIADQLARRAELEKKVPTSDQAAYRTALAVRYLDAGVYAEAYRSFEAALAITPDNELLQANAAVAAARLGKAEVGDQAARARWFGLAEAHYRRAIAISPGYFDALYGLAILLFYELDRPAEAEPFLRRALQKESGDTDAMFVLAAVTYRLGRTAEAIDLYRRIESTARSEAARRAARADRERLEGQPGGS